MKAICEPADSPKDTAAFIRHFCGTDVADADAIAENEPRRSSLYKTVAELVRAFVSVANGLPNIGYSNTEAEALRHEVNDFEKVRMVSDDYIDLKMYESAMRYLNDAYIRSEESEKITALDDLSLVQLIVSQIRQY